MFVCIYVCMYVYIFIFVYAFGFIVVCLVAQVVEYAPGTDSEALRLKTMEECAEVLTEEQELALEKAHTLLGFHAASKGLVNLLSREDLRNAIQAATDEPASDELVDLVLSRFSQDGHNLTLDELRTLLTSGLLYPEHKGRYWVAVSLSEAETIRRILHLRKTRDSQPLIPNSTTEIALRYSAMSAPGAPSAGDGGIVFDSSTNWQRNGSGATAYEASVAHSSFRFFDCDMHFSNSGLNILIRSLKARFAIVTASCIP